MSDPKPRPSLRVDTLASALDEPLDNEAGILDLLVSALARGQANEALWEKLHDAATRDDRLAELAFAYERMARDKKLKSLTAAAQATVLGHAGVFFARVFGDIDGAETYLERALTLSPGDVAAFEVYEQILTGRGDLRRLGELFAAAAPHRGDKAEQLALLRRGAGLVEGDAERALKLNLEILRLDPGDERSKQALAELYEKTGRLADLAKVLEQRASGDLGADEARAVRGRLLKLYAGGLGEIERAMPHVEEVLRAEPTHAEGRRIGEELLGHKAVTGRAAAALGAAYEASGEPAEAARLYGIEVEALRGPKRLEAQKKLAVLTLEQLGDLEKTFSMYEALIPLDPADDDVRARFVQLSSALDKQLEASKTLTRASTGAKEPALKARIGADLGDLFRELGDVKKARAAYQGVLDARATADATLRAARALCALAAEPREPRALAAALQHLAEIEPDEGARLAATIELARVAEAELSDVPAAIAAHERLLGTRLEGEANVALSRLYEATGAFAQLVGVLDRLVAAEKDTGRARALAFRTADLRTSKLPDRGAALTAWQMYVALFGASREALGRLAPLLEHEKRWEELAATLAKEASLSPASEQAGILARLGQLRLGRLNDAKGALDAFRQALAFDPNERQSRLAVDRLLTGAEKATHEGLRLAAADVLEPLARAELSASTLVRVLEVRAGLLADPALRLAALEEAAELCREGLRDPKRATELAARGLVEALSASLDAVPAWVDRVERSSAGGDAGRRAAALRDALGDRAVDHPSLALLARRAGEALVQAGDGAGALGVFKRALAFEPSSPELLARVDALLREQGSPGERLSLYLAALEQTNDAARRRELLHAIGTLERRDLGDPAAALRTYRIALGESPDDAAALAALLEILEATSAWKDLYAELMRAFDRARSTGGAEQAALRLRLAEVAAARGWLDEAAVHYAGIVAGDGAVADDVLTAAERVARERDDLGLLRAVIERRVDLAIDPQDEATWRTRLGELLQARLDDRDGAAEVFARAARAAEEAGEPGRAAELLERVLAIAPGDRGAAERLLTLHRAAEAWAKLPPVYALLLRATAEPAEATRVLLAFEAHAVRAGAEDRFLVEAGTLLDREELGREPRAAVRSARARVLSRDAGRFTEAAAAYRAILEAGDDESGTEARAFDALLAQGGTAAVAERRWLFAHRADRAPEGDRARLLLAWAAAEEGDLGDAAAAADLYGRVVALDPENDAALAAQTRLLLGQGDHAGAAAALDRRRALSAGTAKAALDVELAALLLDPLDRPAEALAVLAPAIEAGPPDPAALRLVERALLRPASRRAAADLLERAADAAEDSGTFAALMGVLLATPADDPALRPSRRGWFEHLLARPDLPPARALDVALAAAAEIPGDLALWERAEQLARPLQAVAHDGGDPQTPGAAARVALAYRRALGVTVAGLDAETIEEIGRRAVEYHEEWFDEPETVIALLRRVIELSPSSTWAFERLKLVYNLAERWDDLFALYDDAVARTEDADARRDLLEDAALAAKDLASDSARAMRYYEALYAIRPEPRVRAALERLFERHGRHRALVDLLSTEMPAEVEAAQKLRARLAQLWLDGVGEAGPAVGLAEEMLAAEPGRAEAVEILEKVMGRPAAPEGIEARRRAASRLKDRYQAEGRVAELARVLEIDLEGAASPAERAERLRALVDLRLHRLHDEAGAFEGTAALLALEPDRQEHRAELERLSERLDRPARLAETLATAAESAAGATRLDLLAEAARVYEEKLGDVPRAVALGQGVLAAAGEGDDGVAIAAARRLDRLLSGLPRATERADVLERLATLEPVAEHRRAARRELARLSLAAGDEVRATRALRAALAEDPGDAVVEEELVSALTNASRWEDLVSVLESRAVRGGDDDRVRADRIRVARLLEDPIGDTTRAVDAWQEVRRTFGADDESTGALSSLLERGGRLFELCALLEGEATRAADDGHAASLWVRIADLHRTSTGNLDEAVAAYDLALELRPHDLAARHGLEALLGAIDLRAEPLLDPVRRTLASAVTSLSRLYGAGDDHAAAIALLEPRLLAATSDAERVAILTETAGLSERRAGDPGGAFDAVFRAFTLSPSDPLAVRLTRLADAADRWDAIAAALDTLATRPDVPPAVLRELLHRVAIWHRDRGEDAAAEAALVRALALAPESEPLLAALAGVQRRAPGRALVDTLLRLSAARGGDLEALREAALVAEALASAGGDRATARDLAEQLLSAATADFDREGASAAAEIAVEALARLADDPEGRSEVFLRGARLPFAPAEQRRLRRAAADLAGGDAALGLYEELFAEDPRDPMVAARLDALYQSLGRREARLSLRERQIAAGGEPAALAALRLDLASLRVEGGDREGAIAALRDNLADGLHAPSVEKLSALYEAGGHDADLAQLCEDRAAAAERSGARDEASALWARAASLAEGPLGNRARAIAAHRRASALGTASSDEALARLLTAEGDHAGAAEVLERICERTPAEAIAEPVLRLVDALRAAGRPSAARARLERAASGERPGAPLRQRLSALYRETGEWKALAELIAEDAGKTPDPQARSALLREAAEIHLVRHGDPVAAIPLLVQILEIVPDDAAVHLRLASARRATGDLDSAAATLRDMLLAYGGRRPKERAVVHFELAQVSLAKGDRPRAVSELDAALRIDPSHPEILLLLGRLSLDEGQLDRAQRTYRTLLLVARRPRGEEAPALNEVTRAEVLFELAEIARLRGEPERAAEQLESAFEAARESPGERDRLLASLRTRGRHAPLARALEARLAEKPPAAEAAAIQAELATLYEDHLGRAGEALDARLSALVLAPPSSEALDRALALARRAGQVERWAAAVTRLAEAEADPDRAVHLQLALGGALEHDLHDDARAAAAYRAAEARIGVSLAGQEKLASIWGSLAGVYGRLGDVEAQEGLLERRVEAAGPGTEPAALADTLYQLAELRLRRASDVSAVESGIELLDRAFETDAQPERAQGLLRDALARGADRAATGRALEHLARVTGADRLLVDALVIRSLLPAKDARDQLDPLREAVAIAERLDDGDLAEDLLRQAVARAAQVGDALVDWALGALAARRAAAGDLAESADLRERAARASDPERERALLLEVASLSAGPLAAPERAARLYEELRAREPAEREIWQPLAEVYRRLGDRTRLAALLEETAPLLEGAAERARLRLERARMAIDEDQEKAVALLKDVIEDDPSMSEAATVLSDLLEKLGRREELAELVRRELDAAKDREDRPRIVQLTLRLGSLLEQQWDEQGALDAYHAALDWEPKSLDVLRQIVRLSATRDDSLALGDALEGLLDVAEGEEAADLALRLAQIRSADSDDDAATAALERGWQARPGDARLRDELTRRYTDGGAWKKLAQIHVADADAASSPAERVALLRRAADLLGARAGDTAGAADVLVRAQEADPKQRDVLVALLEAFGKTGQHARAVEAVGRALAADPADASLYRTRAAIQHTLGKDQAALLDLEQAYEKSGGGYVEDLVAALTKAAAACAGKTTPEARAALRGLRLRLAAVLAQAGDVARARAELAELTRTDGRDRIALRAMALLEESVEDWDAATDLYERLMSIEEGEGLVDTALRLAETCERGDRLGDARPALEQARQIAPDNAEVRERLRQVYNVMGAGRALAQLILDDAARAPDAATRFAHLIHAGRLFLDAENEMESAIAVFEQAKALRPDDPEATLLLADSYTVAGRLAEARTVLDGAVAAQRGRRTRALSAVHRRLARLDLAAGDNAAALAALTRAFDNDPQNAYLAMELGTLAVQLEEHEPATRAFRAVTLMKNASAGAPEGATAALRALAYYHLGRMAFIQGDRRKARLMIDKAVVDDPTLEEARMLLDQLRTT